MLLAPWLLPVLPALSAGAPGPAASKPALPLAEALGVPVLEGGRQLPESLAVPPSLYFLLDALAPAAAAPLPAPLGLSLAGPLLRGLTWAPAVAPTPLLPIPDVLALLEARGLSSTFQGVLLLPA